MRQLCTLNIQCRCKLADKSHTEIIKEVIRKFGSPVIAVQICNEILRVTLWTNKAFRAVKLNEDVYLFSLNYVVLSGGPPATPVHIFDFPFEEDETHICVPLNAFAEIKHITKQKYTGSSIYTGMHLVFMNISDPVPKSLEIRGYRWRS